METTTGINSTSGEPRARVEQASSAEIARPRQSGASSEVGELAGLIDWVAESIASRRLKEVGVL